MPVRKRRNDEPDIKSRRGVKLDGRHTQVGSILSEDPVLKMRIHWRGVLRRSTNSCATRHLSTSPKIALHLSGKFPEDQLKASRELEMRNILNFHTFELVDEMPQGKHASDMVWVDEWRCDRVRSRLCVRQFKAEGLRDDLFTEHQTRSSSSICWPKLRVARISDYSLSTSVLHLCTLEQMREFM